MANLWSNIVNISGDQAQIDELFDSIKGEKVDEYGEEQHIDLNKITPIPEGLEGMDLWEWGWNNWGAKGNSIETSLRDNELYFRTPGGAVPQLVYKLAKTYPELDIHYKFYDSTDPIFGDIYEMTFKGEEYTEKKTPMMSEEELEEMFEGY